MNHISRMSNLCLYLHDESAVLVAVLIEGVQLGDGVIKCLLGELTSLVRAVEDLVVEH